ncbi:hypothetical protein TgHK011_005921 [Trichoderma gracile]|nr:hypothetical protein TgHK011_005921 [Trichoderma gracile]
MTSSTVLEYMTTKNSAYNRHGGGNAANVTCLFPRADSGYGSLDGSSADSPRHSHSSPVSHLGGHGSRHGLELSAGSPKTEASLRLSKEKRKPCPAPAVYHPIVAWNPQQLNLSPGSKDEAKTPLAQQRCDAGGLRSPDRFVPQRDSDKSSKQVYQTTKPLQDLSPTEKLLRRKGPSSGQYSSPQRPPARASDNARMALAGHPRSQVRSLVPSNSPPGARQPSQGNVWMVGGVAPATPEMDRNQRRSPRGVTPARLFTMSVEFTCIRSTTPDSPIRATPLLAELEHGSWAQSTDDDDLRGPLGDDNAPPRRSLPTAPFRVLDAPDLRDDFYCSVLAYSPSCQKLAVGLGNVLYIWSKGSGPRAMHGSAASHDVQTEPWCSSLLMTPFHAFRNPFNPGIAVQTEDLIIGDDTGVVYYYAVEWPMGWEVTRDTWPGTIYLIAKISLHTQQICGLSWSPNGKLFATGGNDNMCCLFDADSVLAEKQESVQHKPHWPGWHLATGSTQDGLGGSTRGSVRPGCLPKHDDATN